MGTYIPTNPNIADHYSSKLMIFFFPFSSCLLGWLNLSFAKLVSVFHYIEVGWCSEQTKKKRNEVAWGSAEDFAKVGDGALKDVVLLIFGEKCSIVVV